MRKLVLAFALTLPLAFATSAQAFPASNPSSAIHASSADHSDLIQVKGGRGGGGKHGWGRGHGGGKYSMRRSHRSYGWSQGRKVGWRGYSCPPGLRMQGRC